MLSSDELKKHAEEWWEKLVEADDGTSHYAYRLNDIAGNWMKAWDLVVDFQKKGSQEQLDSYQIYEAWKTLEERWWDIAFDRDEKDKVR
jgi:hypothetical protein